MSFVEEEWQLGDAVAYVRLPQRQAERPALLIHLTLTAQQGLTTDPFAIVPRAFLAAGHCVASYDLPNHGRLIDCFGEGLTGMAAAFRADRQVFAPAIQTGSALIDAYTQRMPNPGPVLVSGVSRGGLIALHLGAAEPRIAAIAAFAPVTDLLALNEFAGLADSARVREASALALAPRLTQRPALLTINENDARVSTEACREFFAALHRSPELHQLRIDPGSGHTVPDDTYAAGAAWLLENARSENTDLDSSVNREAR